MLIVDDSAAMREIIRSVLTAFGIQSVHQASTASTAVAVLRDYPVDVMIVDWNMQPVDGLALVKYVRDQDKSPNPYLPVIMLTSYTERQRIFLARDTGVTEFVAKPFRSQALYQRLVSIINRPRPFVRTKSFFGPDRRTSKNTHEGEERREAQPIS